MNIPPKYEDVMAQLDAALGREAAFREELAALRESYEAMRDRKNSIVDLQQRLTVAEQLLRRVIACGELTRIDHAELEADVCKWLEPVTPAEPVTFGHEYNNLSVAERSAMQVTARIQEVAALKPAEECPHNYSNPTGCPVCQGIQP